MRQIHVFHIDLSRKNKIPVFCTYTFYTNKKTSAINIVQISLIHRYKEAAGNPYIEKLKNRNIADADVKAAGWNIWVGL